MIRLSFWHKVSVHIDTHSNRKWFVSVTYAETPFFDKTVNYSLDDFSKNGVENSNCSYFAYMYVYMSHGYTAKMSIIACLVFQKQTKQYTVYTQLYYDPYIQLQISVNNGSEVVHFPPNIPLHVFEILKMTENGVVLFTQSVHENATEQFNGHTPSAHYNAGREGVVCLA